VPAGRNKRILRDDSWLRGDENPSRKDGGLFRKDGGFPRSDKGLSIGFGGHSKEARGQGRTL
jgi:hypothetical protein